MFGSGDRYGLYSIGFRPRSASAGASMPIRVAIDSPLVVTLSNMETAPGDVRKITFGTRSRARGREHRR